MILNNEETRQTRKHIVLKSYYKCNTVIYVDIYNQTYNRKQINNWKNDIGTPFFQQGPIDKKFSGLNCYLVLDFPRCGASKQGTILSQNTLYIYFPAPSPKSKKKKKTPWKVLYFSKKNFLNFGMTANQVVR